ncbi:FHA domain-containing protein [Stieleria sp. TO1_6]|uniref:FHA domain-containing protein n=1 Tax=Stieleria tagensis TaxID=2956795 RepID=UPI00209B6802|nr:FHA domain-containing protein [Stieleria tagensis]MCO8121538.1 FHA domain-containing protein [Stieleria tagensis]
MRVILQVTSGPSQGRRIPLQSGERARFGRSDTADVCFPDDLEMADVHFELQCHGDHCIVRDLNAVDATFLNSVAVSEAAVADGDQIVAGQTQLLTSFEGQFVQTPGAVKDPVPDPEPPKLSAAELCQLTDLEERSLELFRPSHSPEEFVRVLIENKQFADAVRILSLYLSKRQAILWAARAVDGVFPRELSVDEQSALDITLEWLQDSSDKNRRAAMAIAEAMDFDNAASCVAAAAFWSEGSMLPEEFDEVLPEETLSGKMVAAALMMTATEGQPATIPARYQEILKIGQEVLAEKDD